MEQSNHTCYARYEEGLLTIGNELVERVIRLDGARPLSVSFTDKKNNKVWTLSLIHILWIFAGGLVLGGAFEYLCSWVQEYLVGTISWEYSYLPFNLNGRTNLLHSFFWGLLALVWVKSLYPQMSRLIERIPNRWGKGITWVLVVFMALNMGLSAMAVSRQTERHNGAPAQSGMDHFLDRHYPDELLWRVYPNMLSARQKPVSYTHLDVYKRQAP